MTLQAPPRAPVIKMGRGIEFTNEALVELIRQRFPNLLDWEAITTCSTPHVVTSTETNTTGLFFYLPDGWLGNEADEPVIASPFRRIGEGAPVPTSNMRLHNLVLTDGKARCGRFLGPDIDQCCGEVGHEGEHSGEYSG